MSSSGGVPSPVASAQPLGLGDRNPPSPPRCAEVSLQIAGLVVDVPLGERAPRSDGSLKAQAEAGMLGGAGTGTELEGVEVPPRSIVVVDVVDVVELVELGVVEVLAFVELVDVGGVDPSGGRVVVDVSAPVEATGDKLDQLGRGSVVDVVLGGLCLGASSILSGEGARSGVTGVGLLVVTTLGTLGTTSVARS